VDRSPELIAVAQDRALHAGVHPEFMIADLLAVTFTGLFDAILCRGVLNDLVEQSDRVAIFQQFAAWLRAGGIAIFDVREWARTAARYEKSSVHQHTVELPDGTLRFQSETILDWGSRQMRIRECFKVSRNDIQTSNVSNFVMGCWTPEEVSQRLLTAGFDENGAYSSYGETDGPWSDRLVLVARKRLA
jgi:2-polyprenyl-3-methyl-5-hydroxy-6-metoxy-1,4-benzoquinol methylase